MGLGEGCAGPPLASREPPRTCGCLGPRRPPARRRAEPAAACRARRGRSHFYAAARDRLFRFCRLRQFAPTFRLKLPASAAPFLSSFASDLFALPLPFWFFFFSFLFFFFFLLDNHHNSLTDAHPPETRAGRASWGPPPPGARSRGRGRGRSLRGARGWSRRASEQRRAPHGREPSERETERRILPGYHLPGEEEAENARRSNL